MPSLHIATPELRAQAFLAVHEVWPLDPDPQVHLARRLASPMQQRAECFVLLGDAGELLSSCLAYPHTLFGPGGTRAARGFGAVHTPSAQRGRGYATKMLQDVMAHYRPQGVLDFTLFSDISPAYYERLGFLELPSTGFEVPASSRDLGGWALGQLPPRLCPEPQSEYRWGFGRDPDHAAWLLRKHRHPLRSWLVMGPEGVQGEVLLAYAPDAVELLETDLPMRQATWPLLRDLLALLAARAGRPLARGWWTSPELHPRGEGLHPRPDELFMWASLRELDPWRAQVPGWGPWLSGVEHF